MAKAVQNYRSLARLIREGKVEPLYFFIGAEQVLARYLVDDLQEKLIEPGLVSVNVTKINGQKVTEEELVAAIYAPPMLGAKRLVVVSQPAVIRPREGENFAKWDALLDKWPDYTCCVLLAPTVDRRFGAFKRVVQKAATYEFPPLTASEAANWVEEQLRRSQVFFPAKSGQLIVRRAGTDLQLLKLEVEKIVGYAGGQRVTEAELRLVVRDDEEANIFDLVDAVGHKEISNVWVLLNAIRAEGKDPLYLIAMIGRQLRLLLQARAGLDSGLSQQQAAAKLGIHPFPAGKCVQQARGWTKPQLELAMAACLEADEDIKTGMLKGTSALDQFLLRLQAISP